MGKFDTQRRCVVCGFLLPNKSREDLILKGFGIRKGDGSVIWHCGQHNPLEILTAIEGTPKFTTAKKEDIK